eukprot:2546090-Karenia_brevis.AAC.1
MPACAHARQAPAWDDTGMMTSMADAICYDVAAAHCRQHACMQLAPMPDRPMTGMIPGYKWQMPSAIA